MSYTEMRGRRAKLAEFHSDPDKSIAFLYIRNVMIGCFIGLIGVSLIDVAAGRS